MELWSILTVCLFLAACTNKADSDEQLFHEKNLPLQLYSVSPDRDTLLKTTGGCIIKIRKESFSSGEKLVNIEYREALSVADMIMGGLRTMSGNRPLSSGGMFYFSFAEGSSTKIIKPLQILVPTSAFNSDMKIFRGVQTEGTLDWQNPVDMQPGETDAKIEHGESLFKANCMSCHNVNNEFAGPSLVYSVNHKSRKWL